VPCIRLIQRRANQTQCDYGLIDFSKQRKICNKYRISVKNITYTKPGIDYDYHHQQGKFQIDGIFNSFDNSGYYKDINIHPDKFYKEMNQLIKVSNNFSNYLKIG